MLKLGGFLFKYRDYTPIPWIILMVFGAQADTTSLIVGTISMALGELIRIHGVAFIGGVSRTRTYSTGQKLITGGPFSHVRNPLYLGNLFLSAGLVIASNANFSLTANDNIWFAVLFVLFFFLQYIPIVKWEESNLKNIFGLDFDEYTKKVPRWFPRITAAEKELEKVPGDYASAIKSEKNTLLASVTIYLLILWRSGLFEKWFF